MTTVRGVLPAGGTDTAGFRNSYGARPVGAVSIPTRSETGEHDDAL